MNSTIMKSKRHRIDFFSSMDTGMDRLTRRWERRDRYYEVFEEHGKEAFDKLWDDLEYKLWEYMYSARKDPVLLRDPSFVSRLRHCTYMLEDVLLCGVYNPTHENTTKFRRLLSRVKKMVHVSKHEKMLHRRFMGVVDRKCIVKKTRNTLQWLTTFEVGNKN